VRFLTRFRNARNSVRFVNRLGTLIIDIIVAGRELFPLTRHFILAMVGCARWVGYRLDEEDRRGVRYSNLNFSLGRNSETLAGPILIL